MKFVIGSDEVGYGAWAGPLMVCAVAVPEGWVGPPGLNDSKMYAKNKAAMLDVYRDLEALPLALIASSNEVIDTVGVRRALIDAHTAAVNALLERFPDADVVVDGIVALPEIPQARLIPRADALVPAVMAASIVAKVNRDFLMRQYHTAFPYYGWDTNAGYGGNAKHAAGLDKHGVSPLHRRSYGPIKDRLLAARQLPLFGGN